MNKSITIVYFNPDCFTDTDVTVLRFLAKEFNVIWFYMYESIKKDSMRLSPEEAKSYSEQYGIQLEVVDPKMRERSLGNILFYRKMANTINKYKPDIVYSCRIDPYWFLSLFCNVKCSARILGIHDVKKHSYGFDPAKAALFLIQDCFVKRFDAAFTFSLNQKDLFHSRYGFDSIMVGMGYKSFGSSIKRPGKIKDGINLLFFGTVNKYKGLDILIENIEELYNAGINNIKLTIAGRGNYYNECQKYIKHLKLYNLQIRFIDNKEIPDLFSSHHFLVLPYRDATQSGPLLTALNYDLPIIAPNFGCFINTYSQKSAFFYTPGCLRETITKVASISQDEYDNMKGNIQSFKYKFSQEVVAHNYINSFKSILLAKLKKE